jgi:CCR4-NOT transcription complex subunit 6
MEELEKFNVNNYPVIMAGDLNSLPDSSVYKLITEGTVEDSHSDFKGHKRSEEGNTCGRTQTNAFLAPKQRKFTSCYGNYREGSTPMEREPQYTNYQKEFNGTLDYIFYDPAQLKHHSLLKVWKYRETA